jgi:hypothetical protein
VLFWVESGALAYVTSILQPSFSGRVGDLLERFVMQAPVDHERSPLSDGRADEADGDAAVYGDA